MNYLTDSLALIGIAVLVTVGMVAAGHMLDVPPAVWGR